VSCSGSVILEVIGIVKFNFFIVDPFVYVWEYFASLSASSLDLFSLDIFGNFLLGL
jgi:hypothetical protein